MSPDPTPTRDPGVMPGVHDFKITIPFMRRLGEGDETTTMIVRIPAANAPAAIQLGGHIGVHIGNAAAAATENPSHTWRAVIDGITADDVDATPTLDEVLAELDHWRRIVTVLAGKFPGMAHVAVDEYERADFSRLLLVPVDEQTMMFADEATLAAGGTAGQSMFAPVPDDVVLPAPYGGHPDPDVRQVKVRGLPMVPPKAVELLHDGEWMLVGGVNITAELAVEVSCLPGDREFETVVFRDLNGSAIVRPAAVEAKATDLPAASVHGRQVLTGNGWWTVAGAAEMGPIAGRAWKVILVEDPARRDALGAVLASVGDSQISTSYNHADQVLLRDVPGSWWS